LREPLQRHEVGSAFYQKRQGFSNGPQTGRTGRVCRGGHFERSEKAPWIHWRMPT